MLVYDYLCHFQAFQGKIKMNQIDYYFGRVDDRLQTLLLFNCGNSFLKAIPLQSKINLWI